MKTSFSLRQTVVELTLEEWVAFMKGAGGKGDGGKFVRIMVIMKVYDWRILRMRYIAGSEKWVALQRRWTILSSPITWYHRRLILLAAMTFYLPIWITSGSAEIFSMLIWYAWFVGLDSSNHFSLWDAFTIFIYFLLLLHPKPKY